MRYLHIILLLLPSFEVSKHTHTHPTVYEQKTANIIKINVLFLKVFFYIILVWIIAIVGTAIITENYRLD